MSPTVRLTSPPLNTQEQCDLELGAFIRAWDQLELRLLPLLNALLGSHQSASLAILRSGIDHPTLRDVLHALASYRLIGDDRTKLTSLIRRWKKVSTKRNRLVHGHWMLCVEMIKGPTGRRDHTKSEWKRFYEPSDPGALHKIFGANVDQKLLSGHMFSLEDIGRATVDVRSLATDLENFTSGLNVLPFSDPQPINIGQ